MNQTTHYQEMHMSDWGYSVKSEDREVERQKAKQVAAVSDATTKADKAAARAKHPTIVWCKLRDQWIDTVVCARMQSQTRILKKCKQCRCQHKEAPWAQKLNKARRKDDPKDLSLGYLRTEQYRVTSLMKK